MEFNSTKAKSFQGLNEVGVTYESMYFVPMIRTSFLSTKLSPKGIIGAYGGFGVFRILSGEISIGYSELPTKVSGKPEGFGTVFTAGVSGSVGIQAAQTFGGVAFRFL